MKKLLKNIKKLMTNDRTVMLAYDHGLEHGPNDFNEDNLNPNYIMEIAKQAKLNAVIFHKGLAEKYYKKSSDLPLVIKLNGKTNLKDFGDPISHQICSVPEAVALGASAVGYTIYLGSEHESIMLHEFGEIVEQAHMLGIPVIAWMYPRGKSIKKLTNKHIEYAAGAALELGADFVKLKFTSKAHFPKVVKVASGVKVLALGGGKKNDKEVLQEAEAIVKTGANGLAIGRNIWQHEEPIKMARAVREIIINNKSVNEVLKYLD